MRGDAAPGSGRGPARSLEVMLTRECMMSCDYCLVSRGAANMERPTLRRAVDLLMTSESAEMQLMFFGGEPLLRFDLMRWGMEYARESAARTGRHVRFAVITNGLLLSDRVVRGLKDFPVEVLFNGSAQMGMDGLHDAGRSDLGRRLTENLKILGGAGIGHFVNLVVDPSRLPSLGQEVERLAELGVRRVTFCLRLGVEWTQEDAKKLLAEVGRIVKRWPQWSPRRELEILNAHEAMDPVMLSEDPVVDCDGRIYGWVGIFLQQAFPELNRTLSLGRLADARDLEAVSLHRDVLSAQIRGSYPPRSAESRVLVNNINIGLLLRKHFERLRQEASPVGPRGRA